MIKIWICDSGWEPWCYEEPCEEGCGWREYPSLEGALPHVLLSCRECQRSLSDDSDYAGGNARVPCADVSKGGNETAVYCSRKCQREAHAHAARVRRARKDAALCAQEAGRGLLGFRFEVAGLTGDSRGRWKGYLPAIHATLPWGSATLYLGVRRHSVFASLASWSRVTGLPIPPPRTIVATPQGPRAYDWNPDDPPEARSQEETTKLLQDWLTREIYGQALDAWDNAQDKLGLFEKWAQR